VAPGVVADAGPLTFSTVGGDKHCGRKGVILSTGATNIFPEHQVGKAFTLGSGPIWTYTKDSRTQVSLFSFVTGPTSLAVGIALW